MIKLSELLSEHLPKNQDQLLKFLEKHIDEALRLLAYPGESVFIHSETIPDPEFGVRYLLPVEALNVMMDRYLAAGYSAKIESAGLDVRTKEYKYILSITIPLQESVEKKGE